MPRSYVYRNGRLARDRGLERGEMLVWTEEQWRDRYMEQYDRVMKGALVPIVLSYLVLVVVIAGTAMMEDTGETLIAGFVIAIIITVVFGITTPLALLQAKRGIAKAPAAGLYEHGLQLTPFHFVPYPEMARTEHKMLGWPAKEEAVVIHPRFDRRNLLVKASLPWSVRSAFLGDEGVLRLEAIVLGDDLSGTPPKLVVYG